MADLRELVRPDLDWDYLYRAAQRHGLLPLLHSHLHGLAAVPADFRQRLQTHARANAVHNLQLGGELLQLLQLFDAHALPALPFKGPTLAALAYGNLALREFGDLDLLMPQSQLPRAKALLLERGYRVAYPLSPRQETAYLRTIRQLPLLRDDGCVVELHTALTPRAFRFPLETAGLWRRRGAVPVLGRPVPAPAAEDLLLILCMHGAKHRWVNLGWVCDVAELLRACPAIDWRAVLRRARQVRGRRLLLLGLDLARRLLGTALPAGVERQVRADAVVGSLARDVCRRLFAEKGEKAAGLASAWFHLRVRERLGDGLAFAVSLALEPTPADWDAAPEWLPWRDYLRRPLRLAAKYARAMYPGDRLRANS